MSYPFCWGKIIVLQFDEADALFERIDNDLIVSENEGIVVLKDFFVVENSEALPMLQLSDGRTISAVDFLTSLDINTLPRQGRRRLLQVASMITTRILVLFSEG